jgi:hypothetical protein
VGGGWLVAVLLGLFVVCKFTTGKWVTLAQLEREIKQARLDTDTWRTIAREADDRADTDRETTRALLAAANVSVRSVQLLSQQLPEQLPQAAGEGT